MAEEVLANVKFYSFRGSDLFTRMLCAFFLRTIWRTSVGFFGNRPESSPDKMYRACEQKDQILKKD